MKILSLVRLPDGGDHPEGVGYWAWLGTAGTCIEGSNLSTYLKSSFDSMSSVLGSSRTGSSLDRRV